MSLQKGQKVKLDDRLVATEIAARFDIKAGFDIDISCFGLDGNDKLSDESYMIFYNQKVSPKQEIKLVPDVPNSKFLINLSALPDHVSKLVFAAAIDPGHHATMGQLSSLEFTLGEFVFKLAGADFTQEKAIMIVELYRKENVWRLGINGQGFNGGLDALLLHFGGDVAPAGQNKDVVTAAPKKISLEKRFEEKAPQLVSLATKASIALEKNSLSNVRAKAAFVIDASGSMHHQYERGQVQETLNRVFPLGVHFDDDEELETWAFALKSQRLSNINFSNYKDYVKTEAGGWKKWMSSLNAGYNNEPAVIIDVIEHFTGMTAPQFTPGKSGFFGFGKKDATVAVSSVYAPAIESRTPIFIIFISDGGVAHDEHIEYLIKWSSTLPIFWQFVGIGGSGYGALQRLDELQGRHVDNANFFAIDDLASISESELYDRMMKEFPIWLKAAQSKGMIANFTI
jgi:stress response protein SCP2